MTPKVIYHKKLKKTSNPTQYNFMKKKMIWWQYPFLDNYIFVKTLEPLFTKVHTTPFGPNIPTNSLINSMLVIW